MEHSNTSYQHNIPDPGYMNIGKLGSGSDLTSETCNGEMKTRRIIVDKLNEAVEDLRRDDSNDICFLEVDCWNHLRNVWLGGMKYALSLLLGNTLREEL